MELQMSEAVETARELATHANDIKHLQSDMDKLVEDMEEIKKSLSEISKTLSEARGGWKALLWAGGAVSALTGIVGFVMGHWGK
jgi:predicted  nucleic acid-binding Zn-ribbon protein